MNPGTKTSPFLTLTIASLIWVPLNFFAISPTVLAETIIFSPGGLAEPVSTITFDELNIPDSAQVSAEFADFGATFLPNLFYRIGDNPDWANVEGPNLRTGDPEVNPFTIHFEDTLTSAAFIAIAQPPTPATITAKLNGVEVESFETTVSIDNPDNYFGFRDIIFDEIEVTYAAETRLRIDNVQLGEPSPGGIPFQITGLDLDLANGEVTITWPSKPGDSFSIEWSEDLLAFTELDDGIEGLEGSTSYTDSVPAGTLRRYYRVGKN